MEFAVEAEWNNVASEGIISEDDFILAGFFDLEVVDLSFDFQ